MAEPQDDNKSASQTASKQGTEQPAAKKDGSGYMAALSGVSSNAGLMGLHMVSATAVGFAAGWFLDDWLGTKPWLTLTFLGMGIIEGFRNMWKEVRKINKKEEAIRAARERGEPEPETITGVPEKLTFFKKEHFHKTYASPLQQDKNSAADADAAEKHRSSGDAATKQAPAKAEPLPTTSDASSTEAGAGEKSDEVRHEVLDEEALRQALIRELESGKGDPLVAEALLSLQQQPVKDAATDAASDEDSSTTPEKTDTTKTKV